mgnify:CR=1 FL=1
MLIDYTTGGYSLGNGSEVSGAQIKAVCDKDLDDLRITIVTEQPWL